jgi:hypothetical protein
MIGEYEKATRRDAGSDKVVDSGGDGEGFGEEDVVEGGGNAGEEERTVGGASSLLPAR